MSCISRRMCSRVCLLPCSTCQKRPNMGRKQGQTCYQWALGRSFTQTSLILMMMMTTTTMMMMSHRRTGKVVAKAKRPRSRANITAPVCFTLSQKEIHQLINCLLGIKLPYSFAGKISRYLDSAKQRFSGIKSHDCHVLMTQLLPVAMRGIMDDHVRETLFGLCNFFDVISRKSVGVRQLRRLQEEIVVILCELEIYFPPAFFDVMVHLLVHIVYDIIQLGPTFLHSMMPFERMNGVIKGYVHNMARPDGSIAQGFLTEECISFCTNYLGIDNPVGLPVNRHLGRLAGWGHREGRREMHVDFMGRLADFERANLVALQHIDVVDPWVVEHKIFIEKTYNGRGQQRTDRDIIK